MSLMQVKDTMEPEEKPIPPEHKSHYDAPVHIPKEGMNFRSVVDNLTPNRGAEIVRYGRRKKDILSLGQGEGSVATPEFIREAAHRALADGKTFYGPALGQEALRTELSDYYKNIYGLDIESDRFFVTSSGTTAMHLALTALLDKGDNVVAVTPIWKNLLGAIELAQANCTEVALERNNGGWQLDMQQLFDSVTPATKAILITTPSNPTGWIMSKDEMRTLLNFARERGIWVISDEVYGRVVFDDVRAPSFLDVARDDDRLFVVNSFSKSWAMTGWRLGWLVGPKVAEEVIRDIALYDNMGPPTFAQFGAIEALRNGEGFIREQIDLWRGNRDIVTERLKALGGIDLPHIDATFYAFFRIDGENDSMALAKRLIDEVSLSLAPGCAFGKVGAGYMRLCFAVSEARLNEALDRFEKVIKKAS